jgi:hypothetical protein
LKYEPQFNERQMDILLTLNRRNLKSPLFNQSDNPDSVSVQCTQLFYTTASLPDSVKVTLKRNTLSPFIDLDLNCFNGGTRGYEAYFYYSVTNATIGVVVQALNKNVTRFHFHGWFGFLFGGRTLSGSFPRYFIGGLQLNLRIPLCFLTYWSTYN